MEGGREVSTQLENPLSMAPTNFDITFSPILKISFAFKLHWLKILKDPFVEDSTIVAPKISHIVVLPLFFETFMSLAEIVEKFGFWRT